MPKESELLATLVNQTARAIERPIPSVPQPTQPMEPVESPEDQEARRLAYLRKPPRQ